VDNQDAAGGASQPAPAPLLRVRSVSQIYQGGSQPLPALHNVTFDVAQGDFVCIVGTSGSGKSTLLRILGGLLVPTEGKVYLADQLIAEPPPDIGFVFQKSNLMPWRTVVDNVLLPLEIQGRVGQAEQERAQAILSTVGLAEFAGHYPAQLSGGMAQRLALARALIQRPRLLLLDEPFGALDALTRERLNLELLRLWQIYDQTVVMVTHSIDEAVFMADRVLVLGDQPGQLVADLPIQLPRPRTLELLAEADYGRLRVEVRRRIAWGVS
jgi:NitT/TauT family transport system ATP-binding protein